MPFRTKLGAAVLTEVMERRRLADLGLTESLESMPAVHVEALLAAEKELAHLDRIDRTAKVKA